MKFKPEHFDILGVICFPFILIYGICALTTGDVPAEWMTKALIVIAIGGILIDGTIVYRFFIKKKKR